MEAISSNGDVHGLGDLYGSGAGVQIGYPRPQEHVLELFLPGYQSTRNSTYAKPNRSAYGYTVNFPCLYWLCSSSERFEARRYRKKMEVNSILYFLYLTMIGIKKSVCAVIMRTSMFPNGMGRVGTVELSELVSETS